jgi:hypothetical protein
MQLGWSTVLKRRTQQRQLLKVAGEMQLSIGRNSSDKMRILVNNAGTHLGADAVGRLVLRALDLSGCLRVLSSR